MERLPRLGARLGEERGLARTSRVRGGKLELYRALGITPGDVVAFVGAGGKSSAILQVAHELREAEIKALLAPTTKMTIGEAERAGRIVTSEDGDGLREEAYRLLESESVVVVGSTVLSKNRIGGVEASWVPYLAPKEGVTLVEADGARHRALKGTASHEPLLPSGATLVVAVGSIRALGVPLDEEHVHRPRVFSELTGTGSGHTIDARAFAQALLAGLRSTPDGANRAALLTDVAPGRSMSDASAVARGLWKGGVRNVVLTSLPKETPGRVWVL